MGLSSIFNETDFIYVCDAEFKGSLIRACDPVPAHCTLYSVNPLDPNWISRAAGMQKRPATPRFALNVTQFRNFIYESDCQTPEEQLHEWTRLADLLPIKLLTYSGGKSYHAVISVLDELGFEPHTTEGIALYKQAWKGIKGFIENNSKLTLDPSTKDPARLTRIPNANRGQVVQKMEPINSRYITSNEVLRLMALYAPTQEHAKKVTGGPSLDFDQLQSALKLPRNRRLYNRLENPHKWVQAQNMYPALFRLTTWAIDQLNPSLDAWQAVLSTQVYPAARSVGYVRDLSLGVRNAYAYKGLL